MAPLWKNTGHSAHTGHETTLPTMEKQSKERLKRKNWQHLSSSHRAAFWHFLNAVLLQTSNAAALWERTRPTPCCNWVPGSGRPSAARTPSGGIWQSSARPRRDGNRTSTPSLCRTTLSQPSPPRRPAILPAPPPTRCGTLPIGMDTLLQQDSSWFLFILFSLSLFCVC